MRILYTKYEKLLKRGKMIQELTMDGHIVYNYKGKQYTAIYEEDYIKLKKFKTNLDILTLIYDWEDEYVGGFDE